MNNFEVLEKLGEGSYSTVYKVLRRSDNTHYAAKKVKFNSLNSRDKQNALNEVRILASVSHPNIIGFKEVFIDESSSTLCLIMEYAPKGDLLHQVNTHKKNSTKFSESEIWSIAVQMVKGLRVLHARNILHRDIKSANVFVNSEDTVQLGDLNVSKVVNGLAHTQTGTPYYASPEVWKDLPYDCKSDIWSLGCVIYELCALEPAFKAKDMKELFNKVVKGRYHDIPSCYSADLSSLIKCLLQVKPALRPSCEKILEMPIVKKNISTSDVIEVPTGLIQTIRVPMSLKALKNKLPAPMYQKRTRNLSAKSNKDDDDKENISRSSSKVLIKQNSGKSFTPSPMVKLSSRQKPEQANIFKSKNSGEMQNKLPRVPKNINNSFV